MTSFAHQAAQIDLVALAHYLEARLPGFRGPIEAEKTPTGQSNPTFLLTSPSGRYVLRKKPPGQLLKCAHAVDREYRVMKGLQGDRRAGAAHAAPVRGRRRASARRSIVMEFVDGTVFWDPALPELSNAQRAKLYDEQNRALAALHSVDPAKVGLADFGKAGSYFARQRDRWTKQYRASETERMEDMETLIAWLEKNEPPDDGRAALVHGDYRIDNMIFTPDGSRLLAVIDWELSTIGHPFSDLAYQCMQWRLPNQEAMRGPRAASTARRSASRPRRNTSPSTASAWGSPHIPHWNFCLAFSFFRLAAIVQGVKKRGLDGNASNPERARQTGEMMPMLAKMGAGVI